MKDLDQKESISVNTVYRHFKGNFYFVKGVTRSYFTGGLDVVYQELYGDAEQHNQPVERFLEWVDPNRPDNVTGQSFRFVPIPDLKEFFEELDHPES